MFDSQNFVSIPIEIIERSRNGQLDFIDGALYCFLMLLCPVDTTIYSGTAESLACELVIPKTKCRESVRRLEQRGLIRVVQKRRHHYIEICADMSNPFICQKYRPAIPKSVRDQVLRRGSCVYCGTKENLTVDHITAYSRGGAHNISNFQCLCAKCNRKKWYS